MKRLISSIKKRFLSSPNQSCPIVFDLDCISSLKSKRDRSEDSFFWAEISSFISDRAYDLLCAEYPHISFFDKHVGIPRGTQRPHDRYYLALNWGPYYSARRASSQIGIIKKRQLSKTWIRFIDQLESAEYSDFISELFQTKQFKLRFAWHMGFSGAEISPHVDEPNKLGTHIFYFNPEGQWDPAWGGQTVLLTNLAKHVDNPEFSDFGCFWNATNIGNNSLIWKNSPTAWHGVRPLSAPEGCFRKIFTVVIDRL